MARTRSSATKAVAAKAPRKLIAVAKSGGVSKRGSRSRALPVITPQPTPAWQKTIDTFLPKPEKIHEPEVSPADNSEVKDFKIVTGRENTPDKELTECSSGLGANTSGLQTESDILQPNEIVKVKSNGVEDICLKSDQDAKESTSGAVETESEKVLDE